MQQIKTLDTSQIIIEMMQQEHIQSINEERKQSLVTKL